MGWIKLKAELVKDILQAIQEGKDKGVKNPVKAMLILMNRVWMDDNVTVLLRRA